jgi:hypothetical protein
VARARQGEKAAAEQAIDFALDRLALQAKRGRKKELGKRADELRVLKRTLPPPQPLPNAVDRYDYASDAELNASPAATPAEQRQMKSSHDAAMQSFSPQSK